jgi:hypothetical protein
VRGIILSEVASVRLVDATDPAVRTFQAECAQRSTESSRRTREKRQAERAQLVALCSEIAGRAVPIEEALNIDGVRTLYRARFVRPLPPACARCQHFGPDKRRPGGAVCWLNWQHRGVPRRLPSAPRACPEFRPHWTIREAERNAFDSFLAQHGVVYSPQRWAAHHHDLRGEFGLAWGFAVGQHWEHTVRAGLGSGFFWPERWLVVTMRSGAVEFREVDGLERVNDQAAFVYEVKHGPPGYPQLVDLYVPLLQRAFPAVRFVPLEINAGDPYRWEPPPGPLTRLRTLAERRLEAGYQLLVLPSPARRPEGAGLAAVVAG